MIMQLQVHKPKNYGLFSEFYTRTHHRNHHLSSGGI